MGDTPLNQVRLDDWNNVLTGLGVSEKDWRKDYTLSVPTLLSQDAINALYESDPLAARMVDAIPEHATRRWIGLTGEGAGVDEDFGRVVLDALEDLDAAAKFAELLRLDRRDGGAVMLIGADDGADLSQPLRLESTRSVKHLHVVERWVIEPGENDDDPRSSNFGQPESWKVKSSMSDLKTGTEIHHSRAIVLRGAKASDLTRRRNNGWGLSVLDRTLVALRRWNTLWSWTEATFKHLSQTLFKTPGLWRTLAEDKDDVILKRMKLLELHRSVFNAVALDSDEELELQEMSFRGVAELVVRNAEQLAAAAEMPLTLLFGTAPSGLSTDDEAGMRNFYDSIAVKQRRLLLKPINYLIEILLHSREGPTQGSLPERWQVDFLPLIEPSDDDVSKRRFQDAQTDAILIQTGAIDANEVRSRLMNDPKSPYQLEDEEAPNAGAGAPEPEPDDLEDDPSEDEGAT